MHCPGAELAGGNVSEEALKDASPQSPDVPHRGFHWASQGFKHGRPEATELVKMSSCPLVLLPD